MVLAVLFYVFLVLFAVWGIYQNRAVTDPSPYIGSHLLLCLLLFIIGCRLFGLPH